MCDEETCRDLQHRISLAQAEVTRMREELVRAIEVGTALAVALRGIEWVLDESGDPICESCGARRDWGEPHSPLCYLGNALEQADTLGWR